VEFIGHIWLLLLFEAITLFIHPYVEEKTHHAPIFMLLILVIVASLLLPLHHKLENWVNETLAHEQPSEG
jgi:CDP-diglyceride synthetase